MQEKIYKNIWQEKSESTSRRLPHTGETTDERTKSSSAAKECSCEICIVNNEIYCLSHFPTPFGARARPRREMSSGSGLTSDQRFWLLGGADATATDNAAFFQVWFLFQVYSFLCYYSRLSMNTLNITKGPM